MMGYSFVVASFAEPDLPREPNSGCSAVSHTVWNLDLARPTSFVLFLTRRARVTSCFNQTRSRSRTPSPDIPICVCICTVGLTNQKSSCKIKLLIQDFSRIILFSNNFWPMNIIGDVKEGMSGGSGPMAGYGFNPDTIGERSLGRS